ncbi:hypothetical protein QAD02_010598 [Eretmocerus hayati]|uniref:Uncharacterized protein n=1 Tax=Eretmocerus hayati TaxID=131215 RepID=A0ACC2NUJ8_9HYME|nr:hypothetical protein QAD02_010598 [Eretmocerus hayati]
MIATEKMQQEDKPTPISENEDALLESSEPIALADEKEVKQPYFYTTLLGLPFLHMVALYAIIFKIGELHPYTAIFQIVYAVVSGIGVTAGAHRLWAHRSYSAKLPLRILLGIFFCMTGENHMLNWIRDHRTHHKFTDTKADPHDSSRGFFFSHCGWLMMRRHPAVKKYGKKIDMTDVKSDPVIQFFEKWYEIKMPIMAFVIPFLVPIYCWNEQWDLAALAVLTRYVIALNAIFSVNSFAHLSGNKPYNKNFRAVENPFVSFFALGEGWHNYHHAFPWDYKTSEFGGYGLNLTTGFIELMSLLGLAYDLKTPSEELVHKVSLSKGDGTSSLYGKNHHDQKN